MSDSASQWDAGELSDIAETIPNATKSLDTVNPGEPLDQLKPVDETLADATVIGVGEVTHASRTVYQLKHRLFRYLIEELDYRVIAVEGNFTAIRAVNEYITEGTGTATDALATEGLHEFWQVEAVHEFVEWAREFNAGREPDDQIRFRGLDVIHTRPPANALSSYLQTVDPDLRAELDEEFEYLLNTEVSGFPLPEDEQQHFVDTGKQLASTLQSQFEDNREQYIAESSESALEWATREAINIGERVKMTAVLMDDDPLQRLDIRDEAMADNLLWLREYESVDKIAVWAHNVHVNQSQVSDGMWQGMTPLGAHLTQQDEITYRALGVSIAGGSFLFPTPSESDDSHVPTVSYQTASIPEPPESSVPGVLAQTDHDYAIIDFDAVPDEASVSEWFASHPARRDFGQSVEVPIQLKETDPRNDFDGLVFVREAQPIRPIDE